jgi:hypothetical protein
MKLAFYVSKIDGHPLDNLIDALSGGGGFSHVELVFSDGQCFSSSTRDGCEGSDSQGRFNRPDGLRFTTIDFKPDRWKFFDIPASAEDEAAIRAWCEKETANRLARYDYPGVLAFVNWWSREHPAKWFCSEAAVAALQSRGASFLWRMRLWPIMGFKPPELSPNRLAKLLGVK